MAQVPPGRSVKGFQVAEQNPATARQSFLTGKDAVPLTRERFRITGLRLEVREKGQLTMKVEAPECLYDYSTRSAWSAGAISVTSGDGRIALQGEGFLWGETNAVLVITNRVQAAIRRDLIQPASTNARPAAVATQGAEAPPQPLLHVRSDRFEYRANDRRIEFTGNTRVEDVSLDLDCDRLAVELPENAGAVERIVAEGHVVIHGKQDDLHANADRASYDQKDDLLDLSGNVTWTMGSRSGRGATIRIGRTTRRMMVREGAFIRLPAAGSMGSLLAETPGTDTASDAVPAFVEVQADSLDLQSGTAEFAGNVEARRVQADAVGATITSQRMVAQFGVSNSLERIEANGDVVISELKRRATAQTAVYTGTGILTLTGNPSWEFEQMKGKAERLVMVPREQRFEAAPAAEVTIILAPGGNSGLLVFKSLAKSTQSSQPRTVRVVADRLDVHSGTVLFHGNVRAEEWVEDQRVAVLTAKNLRLLLDSRDHALQSIEAWEAVAVQESPPQGGDESESGRLTCDRMVALFTGVDHALSSVTASGAVTWNEAETTIQAGRATYGASEDTVELVDQPTIKTKEATILGADTVRWNRTRKSYRATGKWRLEWLPSPGAFRVKPAP